VATAAAERSIDEVMEQAARVYLEDILYDALLKHDEPAKTRELLGETGIKDATMRLIKDIMGGSPRFEQTDRRWTLAQRTEDTQRPLQQIISQILDSCGRPMTVDEMAHELALIFARPIEHYREILPRLLRNGDLYFPIGEDRFGRAAWLIVASSDNEEDVMFFSYLSQDDLAPHRKEAAKWSPGDLAEGALDFLKKAKQPVPARALQFFAWKADPVEFSADEFYAHVVDSPDFLLLSGQLALHGSVRKGFETQLQSLAQKLEETVSEEEEEEAEGPVVVTEADLEEIVKIALSKKGPVRAEEILDSILEISPGEKAYEGAYQSLIDTLRTEPRVAWVGDGRWRTPEDIPGHVNEVPPALIIPTYYFVTPEGEELDQELEDEGLESGLRDDIRDPLVQDVGDEEPAGESRVQPLGDRQRLALKYHHKEAGTFPLCQVNPEFFGAAPAYVNVTLMNEGVRRELWINNQTRLILDMKDWYGTEMPVSGAVFHIERTQRPDEFRFIYEGETDDNLFVPPNRLLELLELKEQPEFQELSTFELITMIMERYKQGMSFAQLFAEVNLVRRCHRRLVASILSSYHCFYRHKDTGWRYDEEKKTKGFNKAKRKYVKKS